MASLTPFGVAPAQLTWMPVGGRGFELRGAGAVWARLRWEKPGGSLALGETAEGQWTFKRVGLFKPRLTIRPVGTQAYAAIFEKRTLNSKGVLTFADGQVFLWAPLPRRRKEFSFTDSAGQPVIRFQPEVSSAGYQTQVHLEPGGQAAQLPLLSLLGCYVLVFQYEDLVATSAAAAIANTPLTAPDAH